VIAAIEDKAVINKILMHLDTEGTLRILTARIRQEFDAQSRDIGSMVPAQHRRTTYSRCFILPKLSADHHVRE